ncbi:hypothetical protein DENSPDRAFT_816901 [Dentipellis sp. KUC8613]|nr:hypothetical protein DENSPDRAFT_816901 [Dentipellis sp. KUC8613]
MSLPTPPGTSHRNKENRFAHAESSTRVVWSQDNKYHNLASPPRQHLRASASQNPPARSILKKTTHLAVSTAAEKQREVTPEPGDPLANLHYLDWPVSQIIAPDATLRSLIEAYSILAARLRSSVSENTDADCSWPLFQPLRKHCAALVESIVRDLGRALVDPLEGVSRNDELEPESPVSVEERTALPSPAKSPRKKRGMSEEQVKYARDLCTTSHSVIKLLGFALTLPAIYRVFTDRELSSILTQVLAIPLASDLPTPNARKTCALAIWLLQTQRLPTSVLQPARDRIAYALRRAIEGELGKEGKKGSVNDGLRAVHELSLYEPSIFIPAFIGLLPSILDNLLAPTLALRTQACHALGGFTLASTRLPPSFVHTQISDIVASFITTPPATPRKLLSPSGSTDPTIIRTLRSTLNINDPSMAAQGPVWALCVLASFIVLLGPRLYTSAKISRMTSALLTLAMRHRKSSVRALTTIVYRCLAWVYCRPPLPEQQSDEDGDSDVDAQDMALTAEEEERREELWRTVRSVVETGAGVATVGSLLAYRSDEVEDLKKIIRLTKVMAQKGGHTGADAMHLLLQFLSTDEPPEWNWSKLLPTDLFCSNPGLLSVEFDRLQTVVRPLLDETPVIEDVRPFSRTELAEEGIIEGLLEVWKEGLTQIEMPEHARLPGEALGVWQGLLRAGVERCRAEDDDEALLAFADEIANTLSGILGNQNIQFVPESRPVSRTPIIDSAGRASMPLKPHVRSNAAMKLSVTRDLWEIVREIIPEDDHSVAAERLLVYLMENEMDLVWETHSPHDARTQWTNLCVELLVGCREKTSKIFWGLKGPTKWDWGWTAELRSLVWRIFVERWREIAPSKWEAALLFLGVPFADKNSWEMSSEDFEAWETTFRFCIDRSMDEGVDSMRVIDHVAGIISSMHIPTSTSSTRVADLLVASVDISEAMDIPGTLLEFVNDTLVSTYPPEPRNRLVSRWLLRSLARLVDACPTSLLRHVLEIIQEGMATWISDEYTVFTYEEYEVDVVPLYENVMICMQSICSTDSLDVLSPLLESAFRGRMNKPQTLTAALQGLWDASHSRSSESWPETLLAHIRKPTDEMDDDVPTAEDEPEVAEEFTTIKEEHLTAPGPLSRRDASNTSLQTLVEEDRTPVLGNAFQPELPVNVEPVEERTSAEVIIVDASPRPAIQRPSTPIRSPPSSVPDRSAKSTVPDRSDTIMLSPASPLRPAFPNRQISPSTPKRSRRSPGQASVRLDRSPDKENASPLAPLASVMERIAQRSPAASTLGKRTLSDLQSPERPLKRSRFGDHPVASPKQDATDDDDCMIVEQALFAFPPGPGASPPATTAQQPAVPSTRTASPSPAPAPVVKPPRKRKLGVFMEAVEVPYLRDLLRKERRANSQILEKARPVTRSVRRTQSMQLLQALPAPKKTRKTKTSAIGGKLQGSSRSSSPMHGDTQLIGSDDSIILAKASKSDFTMPSSDDDPHFGQVTPHHLLSPAMRRALDSDPPSDDSNISVSPTAQRVARKLERASSYSSSSPYPSASPSKLRSYMLPAPAFS